MNLRGLMEHATGPQTHRKDHPVFKPRIGHWGNQKSCQTLGLRHVIVHQLLASDMASVEKLVDHGIR